MTALTQYQRLEATGIWRKSAEAQRLDVIISIGESSLVITDINEKPLAHWSLAALACLLYTSPSPRDRQKSRMPSSA